MNLQGVSVLIDGLNLGLPYETGIKTYGQTLVAALTRLGASVSVLEAGRYGTKDRVLAEVMRFESRRTDAGGRWDLGLALLRAAMGLYNARQVPRAAGVVIRRYDEAWRADLARAFSAPDCYRVAHLLSAALSMTTRVWIPGHVDVWHLTCPLPVRVNRQARLIATVHDLIPLRLPYATLDDKRVYYRVVKDVLRQSSVIIAVSEATKRDLLELFDVDQTRIHVTYEPVGLSLCHRDESAAGFILKSYGLRPRRYVLFVGTIEPKKNIARLIRAYTMLDTSMPLVIIGREGWLYDDVFRELKRARSLRAPIRWLRDVPSSELGYLYAGAYCFVFPSLYEGFGLPALEAMIHGCPVLASRAAALSEVCGDAAAYVDPYDILDIRARLEELLADQSLRDTLAARGREQAKRFSMENYLPRLYKAYAAAL